MDDEQLPLVLRQAREVAMTAEAAHVRRLGTAAEEGRRLAYDVCRDLGLHAPVGRPSTALIAALGERRGWTITVRAARLGELHQDDLDRETGRVRMRGPATWEIIVYPHTRPMHQEIITLTLLAHVLRDAVPLGGRARTTTTRTCEEIIAHTFAVATFSLLVHGPREMPSAPPREESPASADVSPALRECGAAMKPKRAWQARLYCVLYWLSFVVAAAFVVWSVTLMGHGDAIDEPLGPLVGAILVLNGGFVLAAGLRAWDGDSSAPSRRDE